MRARMRMDCWGRGVLVLVGIGGSGEEDEVRRKGAAAAAGEELVVGVGVGVVQRKGRVRGRDTVGPDGTHPFHMDMGMGEPKKFKPKGRPDLFFWF